MQTCVSPRHQPAIPAEEFGQRLRKAQALIAEAGLDALLAHANEADYAHVRYFSDYWTLFECAGVLIPAQGDPVLLIGPESGAYAADRSRIAKIHQLVEYRESADPAYPGVPVSTFAQAFADAGLKNPRNIGIAGSLITPWRLIQSLQSTFPQAELTVADALMVKLRSIKSPAERACLKRAAEISEAAVARVLETIRPGLTEQQVVGIAQQVFYEQGAEYEGHPTYVLSGRNSAHAISRPTPRVLEAGDLVQLNIGARVGGYAASVGLPVCLGTMTGRMRDLVSFGLEAHEQTIAWLQGGRPAGEVARQYKQLFLDRGHAEHFLYGPCHGLGMLEVEQPWMEETSTYPLAENMTFQVDTFVTGGDFGLRWENGGRITDGPFELFAGNYRRILEIG